MRIRDENKIEQVRQKAIELLVKEGFDGFSMQKLAKAAGVSPATLYIYYKSKEDLVITIGTEEGKRMTAATMKDFDPAQSFAEGLKIQWRNRAKFFTEHTLSHKLFEQIKTSPYRDKVFTVIKDDFKAIMSVFVTNAIKNKQLLELPVEVYWSVAFAPLNNLINFHNEGRSMGDRPFTLTDELMSQTFDLVIKALTP